MYRKPLDTLLVGKKNYVSRGFLYIYYTHLLKITEIVRVWNDNGIETARLLSGGTKMSCLGLETAFLC